MVRLKPLVGHSAGQGRAILTTQDLFLPNAHLVIHQPVLFELIAQLNEVFSHRLHAISTQQTGLCRLMPRRNKILRQVLLLLTHGKPTEIEVVPELETVLIEEMIIAQDSYVS